MPINSLTSEEARVLGCLIEKERTTPEYYPLTINSLLAACNQKTNRNQVVEYSDLAIEQTLHSLDEKGLISLTRASGGRATKYVHRAADGYEVDPDQLAVISVLLLRGPQTPGELRSRTERYFTTGQPIDSIETILSDLMERLGPLVARLPREPGQKEHRFRTLITGALDTAPPPTSPVSADLLAERVAALERQLRALADALGVDLADLDEAGSDTNDEDE